MEQRLSVQLRKFVWVLCAFALLFSSGLEARAIRAVIVAKTGDSTLATSTKSDLKNYTAHLEEASRRLDMPLILKAFTDSEKYTTQDLVDYIRGIPAESDDILCFFYTGHGYRHHSKVTQWPILFLGWKQQSLDLFLIACILHDKQAHFSLVYADCCNEYRSEESMPPYLGPPKAMTSRADEQRITDNFHSMYLGRKGTLVVSSSEPGELSWAVRRGSKFSLAVQDEIYKLTRSATNLTWDQVLDAAYLEVSSKGKYSQHPIYQWYD